MQEHNEHSMNEVAENKSRQKSRRLGLKLKKKMYLSLSNTEVKDGQMTKEINVLLNVIYGKYQYAGIYLFVLPAPVRHWQRSQVQSQLDLHYKVQESQRLSGVSKKRKEQINKKNA